MYRLRMFLAALVASISFGNVLYAQFPAFDSLLTHRPRHLEAAFGDNTVRLKWRSPEGNVDPSFYRIYRSSGFHMPSRVGSTADTTFDDTSVVMRTEYNYAVTAVYRDTVESLPSNIAEVFTGTGGGGHDSNVVRIEFTTMPPRTAIVNHLFTYDADASTSPAGIPVCFRLKDSPDGMTIDSASGVVSWTPNRAGNFEVEIIAHTCDTLSGKEEQEFHLCVLSGAPGSVAGTVRNSSGEGLRHITMKLYDVGRGDFVMKTATDDSGRYDFPIANPTTYFVRAKPENKVYSPQWFNGVQRIEDATPVAVPESGAVRVDFTLQLKDSVHDRFRLEGTVLNTGSEPVKGAKVFATLLGHDRSSNDRYDDFEDGQGHEGDDDGGGDHGGDDRIRSAVTDSNGHYLMVLPGGTYIVGVFTGHYLPQFWNHKPTPLDADPLHLSSDTSGIDFNLQPIVLAAGSISGRILYATDSTAVKSHVIAFRKDSTGHFTHFVNVARTDSSGAYTLEHLPDGSYIVLAKDEEDIVPTFYNLSGGTPFLDSASAVLVSGGGAVGGIDIYVQVDSVEGLNCLGGMISLNSSSTDGTVPLAGVIVTISNTQGNVTGSAISQGDGSYMAVGLAPGTYNLLFQKPGIFGVSVQASLSYQNNAPTTTTVNARLSDGNGGSGLMSLRAQWNLVSLPVNVSDPHRAVVFPGAVSQAYGFASNKYSSSDLLDNASGYWLKFSAVQVMYVDGTARTAQTIPLSPGWNLIGSISTPVSVASLHTSQPGLLSKNLFGYNGGYYIATSIDPGKGYWVKASAAGTVTLAAGTAEPRATAVGGELKEFNSLTLSDDLGNSQTLYFGSGSVDEQSSELPPLGPEGLFDARFSSQRFVVSHPAALSQLKSYPILLQSGGTRVTAQWSVKSSDVSYSLTDQGRSIPMKGTGSTQLSANSPGYLALNAQPVTAPKEFMLYQNYPNPFNPTTKIAFDLPQAAQVTLKIYNVIGQEVATLAENAQYEAGRHTLVLDASTLVSGLYFTKLQAGSYSAVRKIVLVK